MADERLTIEMVRRRSIWADLLKERVRQEALKADGKFLYTCADAGMLSSEKFLVLAEEVGEVARVLLNMRLFSTDFKADLEVLREELIQVGAVTVAWLEFVDGVLYPLPPKEPIGETGAAST